MIDVLQFIFQDFWHWVGAVILLGVVAAPLGSLFRFVHIKKPKDEPAKIEDKK